MRKRAILLVSGFAAAAIVIVVIVILSNGTGPSRTRPPVMAMMAVEKPSAPQSMDVAEPYAPAVAREGSSIGADAIRIGVPQLAYDYVLGYRMPGSAIVDAQQSHLALCARLGAARCQLLAMERKSDDDGDSRASLKLRVASGIAPSFSDALAKAVVAAGGRAIDAHVTAEDVSKQLVDTDARIRQREILVARLTTMLRNRQGRVSELVEAERSVAQAQEELDQAKGWLRELRGRVAFSDFTISYAPVTSSAPSPRTFGERLREAVAQSGGAIVGFFGGLLMTLVFVLPWAVLATPFALYALGRRRRRLADVVVTS